MFEQENGKTRRMRRILKGDKGRCLMVPLDHGAWLGPKKGLDKPRDIVSKVLLGGANALLVSPGFYQEVTDLVPTDVGVVLRTSLVSGPSEEAFQENPIATVKTALQMDADGVAVSIFFGRGRENFIMRYMGEMAESCREWDMPIVLEMLPTGDKTYDINSIAHVSRIAMEIGADIIKTNYTGPPEVFNENVIQAVCRPVIIAGGEAGSSEEEICRFAENLVSAGARGVAMGRKIWQSDDPTSIVEKLRKTIFG
jgi:fructose-bisphosphate aldolase / 2-amino-3,7-dideoxy-D-threo-hept-6-ulosonate synthase